jgi:hypothetical protein
MRANLGLIALLRSTLARLDEEENGASPGDFSVSKLKQSILLAMADLEQRKLDAEKVEKATEVAALLARAGRAAYVVHARVSHTGDSAVALAEPDGPSDARSADPAAAAD